MLHHRLLQLFYRRGIDQALVAARSFLEILVRAVDIHSSNDFARAQEARIPLLFPPVESEPWSSFSLPMGYTRNPLRKTNTEPNWTDGNPIRLANVTFADWFR